MSAALRAKFAEAALLFANTIADAVESELRGPTQSAKVTKVRRVPKSRPLAKPRTIVPEEEIKRVVNDARRRGIRVG